MECNCRNDVVELIARRDHISLNEAENLVDECVENIGYYAMQGRFDIVEDIMLSDLSLELDYLDLILM